MRTLLCCASTLLIAFCTQASATTITYVDANASNTTIGGSAVSSSNLGGWSARGLGGGLGTSDLGNFGNEGGVFQIGTGNAPAAPASSNEFTTTISGLDAGTSYNIYAFFWGIADPDTDPQDVNDPADADDDGYWDFATGLTSGSLSDFIAGQAGTTVVNATTRANISGINVLNEDPMNPGTNEYDTDLIDNNRVLYFVNLGEFTGGSSVDVFVNGSAAAESLQGRNTNGGNSGTNDSRTWYDGVGFAQVIPEPASATLLLGLVGVGLTARRRK